MRDENERILGEQSKWKVFIYLLRIGDYGTAFRSLFWKRPHFMLSILYANNEIVIKRFKYRSDAYNYVVNEGDHVVNYVIQREE